ncbi:hypothetical protein Pla108_01390 [Botrimarina colliarenosi]|uniref:Uncharacterized protein n=1 Tax=Botrimarina colliarenosi TaxID=2528001 RepID=A0A5C6AGV3_9BACT|nr:hypothetical protein [Botrimarina colliarenosi]TWT99204.1 hypothetical protein Pla108_01390 [Botrimarina colliarenosi]
MAHRPANTCRLFGVALAAWGSLLLGDLPAQEPAMIGSPTLLPLDAGSAAYPDGSFGEQLSAAAQGGDGPVGGPKHRPGAGRRDSWLVGPHWRATVDGVLLFREGANLDAILAEVDPIAPQSTLPPLEFLNDFDHAAGVRLLLTSEFPQCAGYELQIGYVGVEKWLANAYWEEETIPAASLPLSDIDVQQRRQLTYDSSLHSLEVNFQRLTDGYLKPFAGVRYLSLDESVADTNRQFTNVILGDPVDVGDTLSSAIAQQRQLAEIENNLIGFQSGLRLDMWRPTRRLHLSGFVSAGVYCNILDRNRVSQDSISITTKERVDVPATGTTPATTQVNTTTNSLDTTSVTAADGTRIAFTGEAALAATWKLSSTTALRGGYQVLFLDGIELAENLWTAPPPITPQSDELFLHGWFAGLEYRR